MRYIIQFCTCILPAFPVWLMIGIDGEGDFKNIRSKGTQATYGFQNNALSMPGKFGRVHGDGLIDGIEHGFQEQWNFVSGTVRDSRLDRIFLSICGFPGIRMIEQQ